MKVDVITVEQATFKKWQWWSNWIDVCIFDHDLESFLLQMKVSRTNRKKFAGRPMRPNMFSAYCGTNQVGDLTQMGKGGEV
jgi:hypothetical protein